MEKVIGAEVSVIKAEESKVNAEEPINDKVQDLAKVPPKDNSNEWPNSEPINQDEKEATHQPTIQPTTIHDDEEK